MKKQLINSSSNQLDITGQNLQNKHGKSSAYLQSGANSGTIDLQ